MAACWRTLLKLVMSVIILSDFIPKDFTSISVHLSIVPKTCLYISILDVTTAFKHQIRLGIMSISKLFWSRNVKLAHDIYIYYNVYIWKKNVVSKVITCVTLITWTLVSSRDQDLVEFCRSKYEFWN